MKATASLVELAAFLRPFLARHRARFGWGLVLLGAHTLLELTLPFWLGYMIDTYVVTHRWREGLWVLGVYAATIGAVAILQYVHGLLMDVTAYRVMRDLRCATFRRLTLLPLPFFHRQPVGKLMTRVTNDVDALQEMLGQGVLTVIADLVASLAIFSILWWISPVLALVVTATALMVVAVGFLFQRFARRAQDEIRYWLARLNAFFQEHIGGVLTLQIHQAEPIVYRDMQHLNRRYTQAYISAVVHYAWYYPAIRGLEVLTSVVVLIVGGWLYYQARISIGTLVAFFQYIQRFFEPLADLSDKYNTFLQAMVASERIMEIHREPLDSAYEGRPYRPSVGPAIRFNRVAFQYDPHGPWVLRDVDLHLRPGERVAIAGPTGSGKTTLVALLLRFYEPTQGVIRLDGIPIRQINARDLRRAVRVVFQEPFLFSDTVRSNILLRDNPEARLRLEQWLERLAHNDLVRTLQSKLDTVLGERGMNLSQSERQAIALLRGILSDPAVLILDEALSATDPKTEHDLHELIRAISEDRTVIFIAHRLQTLPDVDRVVLLWDGRVVEQGPPEELLRRDSLFRALIQLQSEVASSSA